MEESKPRVLKLWHKIFLVVLLVSFLGIKLWQTHAVSGNVELDGERLQVEIAETLLQSYKGLGDRDMLAPYDGMLFLFDFPSRYGFVMRDMRFPIDIVWIKDGAVVDIAPNVPIEPGKTERELTVYYPRAEADMVLELEAGWAETHDLRIGDRLRLLEK